MQFANFEEFWAALGRLYDETLEIKESIGSVQGKSIGRSRRSYAASADSG